VDIERNPEKFRALPDRSPTGARLRRRAAATGGFTLMLLGFFVALDLIELVGVLVALLAASAALLVAVALLRRVRPRDLPWRLTQGWLSRGLEVGERAHLAAVAVRTWLARTPRPRVARPHPKSSPRRQALRLNAEGAELRRSGDLIAALKKHNEALEVLASTGDRHGEALTHNSLALTFAQAGNDDVALEHFDRALAILRALDDAQHEGRVIANLGFMHVRRGRRREAAECLQAALERLSPDTREYRQVAEELRRAS
jgi:tetratricopeptide (TPR) repeat protein